MGDFSRDDAFAARKVYWSWERKILPSVSIPLKHYWGETTGKEILGIKEQI